MQKIINVLALASTVVSVAVVGTGAYVYVNKDSIIESIKEKALGCLLYTSPSPRDGLLSRMPSSA